MEHLPGKEDQLPQVQIVDAAADGIPHTAARYRQDQLIVGVRVYDRLAVELVGVPCYQDIAALQGGAGLLLREKRIYIMRYFLYDHGAGLPTNFVLKTIISHFAIFALQKAEKFGRIFDIIMTK